MRIGALMVTESRAPIWGIGLASYLSQTHRDTFAHVYAAPICDYVCAQGAYVRLTDASPPASGIAALLVATTSRDPRPVTVCARLEDERGPERVCRMLDKGAAQLFSAGADVVAVFDDDDWSPPDRLDAVAAAFGAAQRYAGALDKHALIASYTSGWMVNLRTLEGLELTPEHPWGSTLAFNRFAWLLADGFSPGPWPGQDRAFCERAQRRGAVLLPLTGQPINFCHGKNVASFAAGAGLAPQEGLLARLPPMVEREVRHAQAFLVSRNIWPPGTGEGI